MMADVRAYLAGMAAMIATPAAGAAQAADDFKMGLLVAGSVAEKGWSRIAPIGVEIQTRKK